MDTSEIIKAAPEASRVVAALVGSDLVRRMLGPAVDELGERWRDQVRLYRYGRQISCVKKAEKMARDGGFTPKAVPIKLLFPLLEGASLEENETLHDMFASLLANASSQKTMFVRPGFIALLKQMAPDEAALLWSIVQAGREVFVSPIPTAMLGEFESRMAQLSRVHFVAIEGEDDNTENARYDACIETLKAEGLIGQKGKVNQYYDLTSRGKLFIAACTPPTPKP
jgi:hypothetical protein